MKIKKVVLSVIALGLTGLVACSDTPAMYGRKENVAPHHISFGNSDLEYRTRYVDPISAGQDAYGLLHVQLAIRSTYDPDQYVDAFITFTRNGQVVERIGPKTEVIRGHAPDTISFNSTQPADDFSIFLDYAK